MITTKARHEARDQLIQNIQNISEWFTGSDTYIELDLTAVELHITQKTLDLAIRHIRGCHELMDAVDNVLGVIGCEGEIDSRHEFTQRLLDLMYELDPK